MHDRFVFCVLLTQYAFLLTIMVSLKHRDRKLNMPTTFVVKNICIGKHARVHGNTSCILKFADSGYYVFFTHLSTECSVSYCDHSPSVHNFLVNTLASSNMNQSAPNLVRMYMTIRSQMSSIMEVIRPELSKLSALELENLPYLTVNTPASANIDQSVPNLATIYMPIRSRMSSVMGQIESECPELFALEFGKIAEYDFVYTLSSTNIDQTWSKCM